jgi:hypothetical protein
MIRTLYSVYHEKIKNQTSPFIINYKYRCEEQFVSPEIITPPDNHIVLVYYTNSEQYFWTFKYDLFNEHFISEKEYRKLKLEKINGINI